MNIKQPPEQWVERAGKETLHSALTNLTEVQLNVETAITSGVEEQLDAVRTAFAQRASTAQTSNVLTVFENQVQHLRDLFVRVSSVKARLNVALQSETGASLNDWVRRGKEFVRVPERRAYMLHKLNGLLVGKTLEYEEMPMVRDETDPSGFSTIVLAASLGNEALPFVRHIHFLAFPANVSIETVRYDGAPQGGPAHLQEINSKNPNTFNFLIGGVLADITSPFNPEVPFLGTLENGTMVEPFKNRNPKSPLNRFESGGIIIEGGKLSFVHYPNILEAPGDTKYQTCFIADETSWKKLLTADAYRNNVLAPVMLGKMTLPNGEERIFIMHVETLGYKGGIALAFSCVQQMAHEMGAKGWQLACIDFGGIFSGMLNKNGERVGYTYYDKGEREFVHGHNRNQFFIIKWPKN